MLTNESTEVYSPSAVMLDLVVETQQKTLLLIDAPIEQFGY